MMNRNDVRIYDNHTKVKTQLPDKPSISLYVCGPTVYDDIHLGNARCALVFDAFVRLLRVLYDEVNYASNITDIDQKIIDKAAASNKSWKEVSEKYTNRYFAVLEYLNITKPTFTPFAVEYIPKIIDSIAAMLDKGLGYVCQDGVYFDSTKCGNDERIFQNNRKVLKSRLKRPNQKKHESDFVLWRFRSEEPYWQSPWGRGIPGWHTECTVMVNALFGDTVDLHGGGKDLAFPHHENERIQGIALFGGCFAKLWMHVNFVLFNENKMSKSDGNVVNLKDLMDIYPGEAIRLYILKTHYRKELDFQFHALDIAYNELNALYEKLNGHDQHHECESVEFLSALCDDLNTPLATSLMFQLKDAAKLRYCTNLLGICQQGHEEWVYQGNDITQVAELVRQRNELRKSRLFKEADAIRLQLIEMGIALTDSGGDVILSRHIITPER